jgi:alpha-mannosidase
MSHEARFTAEKIAKRVELIRGLVFREAAPLQPFRLLELPDAAAQPPLHADPSGWAEIAHRSYWGRPGLNFLLRSHFQVPTEWEGNLALHLPMGVAGDIFTHPEALVYVDGRPIASADRYHHTVPLPQHLQDGQRHQLALHGWTGLSGWPPDPNSNAKLYMETCRLVMRDKPTQQFLWLANAALKTARTLLDRRSERHAILTALDRAFLTLDTRDPVGGPAFYASVPPALEQLRADLAQAGRAQDVTLHAVGHAHMDIAYLWPVSQMRRKIARTTSNALRLMQEYAGFRFSNSQAILYQFLEEDYPEIFDGVRAAVARGQWEVMGGMWVEPDVNLPGPESLVRQITLARRWFRRRFGEAESPVLWLPDTFGFPWCLPQLMAQAGLRWFSTNKLNWNQHNRMPSTFWWEGIDGTKILSHVLTTPRPVQYLPFATNYKSDLTAEEVLGTWEHSTQKARVRDLPICYGYGDGGGGPTEGLIQTAFAYRDMPGMPRMRMSTVREAFEQIERSAEGLPVWQDELYMEGHRGTLTSNGAIKRANRRAEAALHEAEALLALTGRATDLTRAWELLCLNQFHDIITGTSIPEVFEDAAHAHSTVHQITEEALAPLAGTGAVAHVAPARAAPLVLLPDGAGADGAGADGAGADGAGADGAGADGPGQDVEGGRLVQMPVMEPYSARPLAEARAPRPGLAARLEGGGAVLENAVLRVEINAQGQLTSVRDLEEGREVLAPGQLGNVLQVFEDRPVGWDAWDIDPFFEDRMEVVDTACEVTLREAGPLRATIRIARPYRDSRIVQDVSLGHESRLLRFDTQVDWHQTHMLAKVAFPVDIRTPRATYGMQWGRIERPTHRNTSWDASRYEVCAHGWADLSDWGYGAALLSDCKYGFDVRDQVLRLSLLKSATMPDPDADQGVHRFAYALLPHPGGWRAGGVEAEAAMMCHPPRLVPEPLAPPATCAAPNVVLQTLKPAEDGEGVVLRLFEAHRRQGRVRLDLAPWVATAATCDLLEEGEAPLDIRGGGVELHLTPFQIVTLRLRP